jgi:predicted GH43/DUF377 family glycosyl hydrolase
VKPKISLQRLVSRGELPGSDGGIYNPGAILKEDRIVLMCRREIDYRFTKHVFAEEIELDASTLGFRGHRTLINRGFPEDARIEDFRPFEFQGEILVTHTVVTPRGIRPRISRVVDGYLEFFDPMTLPVPLGKVEKNWVLFEHENALHCLYSLDPLTIFRRGPHGGWHLVLSEANGWRDELQESLSNSTNLIPFMGGYLGFWHTRIENDYVQGAFLLGQDLRLKYRTPTILDSSQASPGYRPGTLYVSGLVQHERRILAFYGEGDAHTSVAIMEADELADMLRQYPFKGHKGIYIGLDALFMGELYRKMLKLQLLADENQDKRLWLKLDNPGFASIVEQFGIPQLVLRHETIPCDLDIDLCRPESGGATDNANPGFRGSGN